MSNANNGNYRLIEPTIGAWEAAPEPVLAGAAPAAAPGRQLFVVVLGMHRSGTSLCSHILRTLGVAMGDQPEVRPSNPRGHWERLEIVERHDRILELFNRGYYSPLHDLPLPAGWSADPRVDAIRREIVAFVRQERGNPAPCGFKDPRTARLMPMWRRIFEELGLDPKIVLCLRNPAQVARSLQERDELPRDLGEYRWFTYMAEAFSNLHDLATCTIEYEAWFDDASDNLAKLTRFLGLPLPAESRAEVAEIVDRQLRHDDTGCPGALQPMVRSFYELVRRCEAEPAARAEIAHLLDRFAAFQQLHSPIGREFEQLSRMVAKFRGINDADAARRLASWRRPAIEAEWNRSVEAARQAAAVTARLHAILQEAERELAALRRQLESDASGAGRPS